MLCNLCLAGDAVMTYVEDGGGRRKKKMMPKAAKAKAKAKGGTTARAGEVGIGNSGSGGGGSGDGSCQARYEVYLPRRSLQMQTGHVRYNYQHSISNKNLFGDRRVSITFRQNICTEFAA